jgi:hypothetical protein
MFRGWFWKALSNNFEVWKECRYFTRDGLFNPDGRLINDVGNFQSLSDAVLYNAIAHSLEGTVSSNYSKTAGASNLPIYAPTTRLARSEHSSRFLFLFFFSSMPCISRIFTNAHATPLIYTVTFVRAWFLDSETRMNPNLNFAQMQRGPTGQTGSHTGILFVPNYVCRLQSPDGY